MEDKLEKIENLLGEKLLDALTVFKSKELNIIDIGIFPWHGTLEISFLFKDDDAFDDDIAGWPFYNHINVDEYSENEAGIILKNIKESYKHNHDAEAIFLYFAKVVKSKKIKEIISKFNLSSTFKIQILNPDDFESKNYCE